MTAYRDRSELRLLPRRRRSLSQRRLGVSAALFAVTLTLLLYSVYGTRPAETLAVGEPSPRTFLAPQQLSATD